MSDFDFSTLVTDRVAGDVSALGGLLGKPLDRWTAEELADFNRAASRGAYNCTDLNRVTACMDALAERLLEHMAAAWFYSGDIFCGEV